MSKGSLQSFEYKIKTEDSIANDIKYDMQDIGKSILSAMNDRVGENAINSINRISEVFIYVSESVISKSKSAARTLEVGYDRIDVLLSQGDKLISDAERLMGELGDYNV